jgi:hypothetical protein
VVDVLNTSLGVTEKFGPTGPANMRAIEIGASQLPQVPNLAYLFRIFGRPPRTSACDCERAMEPALPQKLFLMTDANLLAKFQAPTGRLQTLLKSGKNDDEMLEELFLATLSRLPTKADRDFFAQHRATQENRQALFTDALWALINTREFILNH